MHFIQKLPALRRLVLYGLTVTGDGRTLELAGLDETQLIAEYPLLFALLSFVTHMPVTTLIIAPDEEQPRKQYRWQRLSRDEPFEFSPSGVIRS